MTQSSEVREILQYIPQFRGRTFFVLIEAGLLPEPAIAETLLDRRVTLPDLFAQLGLDPVEFPVELILLHMRTGRGHEQNAPEGDRRPCQSSI